MVSEDLEEKNCLQFANITIIENQGKQTKDLIREHLVDIADIDVDFIFIGNQGADFTKSKDDYLGSVANELIVHTKLNVIFVC
jgi:nucleotide-binding universal stress UspA family protein